MLSWRMPACSCLTKNYEAAFFETPKQMKQQKKSCLESVLGFLPIGLSVQHIQKLIEPRSKNPALLSIEYWLFNRDI